MRWKNQVAKAAPTTCAAINAGACSGAIPENVSVKERAIVTAGFAKDVEAVNQYAAAIYNPTMGATADGRARSVPRIVMTRPKAGKTLHS